MFKFLGGARAGPPDLAGIPAQTSIAGKEQRELVRVALKSLLAEQNIPLHWIGFELERASTDARASLTIRLVMQEWQESLLRYLPVISAAIVGRLRQLDPANDHQHDSVTWSFAADCGYPETGFPAQSTWGVLPGIKAVQSARNTARLEEIFARAPAGQADFDAAQQTQPMNLDAIPSNFMASIPGYLDSETSTVPQRPARPTDSVGKLTKAKFELLPSPLDSSANPFASTEPGKLA